MCSVSDEDVEAIVRAAVKSAERPRVVSHRLESLSGERRHGIMGNHYVLAVRVRGQREPELPEADRELRFFVKTPPASTGLRDSLVDEWVSLEEVHFFDEVYPALVRDYAGPRWCAECYLARPELLVFGDLGAEGFAVRRDGVFDEASLEAALATLARFHAASVVAEARVLGAPLDRVYPRAFREKIFTDVGKAGRANRLAFDTMRLLAEKFGLDASPLPGVLRRLCQLVKPVPGGCNVICHGDLWRSNIMFADEGGAAPECVLVDFQMLRYAPPSVDLAALLYVHASPGLRASSEPRLLRHYYSAFRATLAAHGVVVDDEERRIPSFEQFLRDYEERKLVGMACACTRWPKCVFERVVNEPAALRDWYFANRIDIYEEAIGRDPNYARITRDCLLELLQEGKRVLNL